MSMNSFVFQDGKQIHGYKMTSAFKYYVVMGNSFVDVGQEALETILQFWGKNTKYRNNAHKNKEI
jgi:hypothetical protein